MIQCFYKLTPFLKYNIIIKEVKMFKNLILVTLLFSLNSEAYSLKRLFNELTKQPKTQHSKEKTQVINPNQKFKYPERGNQRIDNFSKAKKILEKVYGNSGETIYCGCKYSGKSVDLDSCGLKVIKNEKRAKRLEWEHSNPAENFGRVFPEWRDKAGCSSGTSSRKCAENNPLFNTMESDLYNLFPSEGEVNGLRSNYEYQVLSSNKYDTGSCKSKFGDKAFEPRDEVKGMMARANLYMDWAYEGVYNLSDARRKFFQAWDKMYPVTQDECKFARIKKQYQGNENPFLKQCY